MVDLSSPPSHPVVWVIKLKDGSTASAKGQTAFVACASIGVLLSEVEWISPKES